MNEHAEARFAPPGHAGIPLLLRLVGNRNRQDRLLGKCRYTATRDNDRAERTSRFQHERDSLGRGKGRQKHMYCAGRLYAPATSNVAAMMRDSRRVEPQ